MSKSIVIDSIGNIRIKNLDDLKSLQNVVGGYIEHISFPFKKNCALSGFINEEGKILNLPVNRIASLLWMKSNNWDKLYDVLCGDVIITGCVDDEGDTKDITDEQLNDVMLYIEEIKGNNN